MITTVTNFGDGLSVQLPKPLLKNVRISENDDVEIFAKDNCLIIQRQESKKPLTTKERIVAFGKMDEVPSSETDWGKPQGKEIW